jgi:hypothetical protein
MYIDGRFRFVGGSHPFWNEKLTPLRGPMAIPAKSIGDLMVQGVPVDVDRKTPGILAIVVLDVKIGSDGRAHGCKVKSGDPQYIKQLRTIFAIGNSSRWQRRSRSTWCFFNGEQWRTLIHNPIA